MFRIASLWAASSSFSFSGRVSGSLELRSVAAASMANIGLVISTHSWRMCCGALRQSGLRSPPLALTISSDRDGQRQHRDDLRRFAAHRLHPILLLAQRHAADSRAHRRADPGDERRQTDARLGQILEPGHQERTDRRHLLPGHQTQHVQIQRVEAGPGFALVRRRHALEGRRQTNRKAVVTVRAPGVAPQQRPGNVEEGVPHVQRRPQPGARLERVRLQRRDDRSNPPSLVIEGRRRSSDTARRSWPSPGPGHRSR